MAGSHEVRGSIPLGSTNFIAPFFRTALFRMRRPDVARDPSASSCPLFLTSRTKVRFGQKAGQSEALDAALTVSPWATYDFGFWGAFGYMCTHWSITGDLQYRFGPFCCPRLRRDGSRGIEPREGRNAQWAFRRERSEAGYFRAAKMSIPLCSTKLYCAVLPNGAFSYETT